MRIVITFVLTLFGLGCNNQAPSPADKPGIGKVDNSAYYTTKDTLVIVTDIGDTLKYEKQEFNEIIDNHPELVSDNMQHPDQLYHCDGDKAGFNSEAGQDGYFMLYAYFLKQKNGETAYAEIRKKLIDIYTNINAIFMDLEYGGTYFGHQQARIPGYAEYAVALYKRNENYPKSPTYDITKQKELYIQSLVQLIKDETGIDTNTTSQEKIELTRKLHELVGNINKLITDNYYLKKARQFQYEHYGY